MPVNRAFPARDLVAAVTALAAATHQLERQLDRATRGCGLRQVDLRDAGCNDYQARRWGKVDPDFADSDAVLVGGSPAYRRDENDIVALIASRAGGHSAADQYANGVYLRDRILGQPVRHIASLIGTDQNRTIKTVRPILARYLLKSAKHHPGPGTYATASIKNRLLDCLNNPEVQASWPGPLDAFVLGTPIPIDLPLGWQGGIPGTRHHRLGDLLTASELRGLSTV